jgi:hypothetical protein
MHHTLPQTLLFQYGLLHTWYVCQIICLVQDGRYASLLGDLVPKYLEYEAGMLTTCREVRSFVPSCLCICICSKILKSPEL